MNSGTASWTPWPPQSPSTDRKLDVILARLDGMKVLGQVILGALGLLTTVLIAVFGFLFMN